MASSRIQIHNLTKEFAGPKGIPSRVLDQVSVEIRDEEIVCLLGPSGCGKSTLLNIIAGFETPDSGTVTVSGQAVTRPGPDRAVVFQTPALLPWFTVTRNITLGVECRGMPREHYSAKAEEYVNAIGLQGFEHHYPYQLSGGMRQRVSIARALIGQPEVLLLDEPFGALDAQTRLTMQELLLEIWERYRPTIVFVTHDVDEAIFLASRVLVMSARPGCIREEVVVPISRPRTVEALTSRAFVETKKRLLDLVHTASVGAARKS
jgi:NitT/TauT family transport system ATP-binding protein